MHAQKMPGVLQHTVKARQYQCRSCSRGANEWILKCPACGRTGQYTIRRNYSSIITERIIGLGDPNLKATERFNSGHEVFNNVCGGGGIPRGAVILLGGSEGGGKSTICTTILCLADCRKTLLCSGEENGKAVNERAHRLELNPDPRKTRMIYTTDSDEVFLSILSEMPDLVVVDSAQAFTTMNNRLKGSPGSASQIKYLVLGLVSIAKKYDITIIVISQVNQDGTIAGPQKQKHWVDAVIELKRNERNGRRSIRALKSRFCETHVRFPLLMTKRGVVMASQATSDTAEHPRDTDGTPVSASGNAAPKVAPKQAVPPATQPALRDVVQVDPVTEKTARPQTLKDVAAILADVEAKEKAEEKKERAAARKAREADAVESRAITRTQARKPRRPPPDTGPLSSRYLSGSDEDDDEVSGL